MTTQLQATIQELVETLQKERDFHQRQANQHLEEIGKLDRRIHALQSLAWE
jgi:hypothetical protein